MESLRSRVSYALREDISVMSGDELTEHAKDVSVLAKKIMQCGGMAVEERNQLSTELLARTNEARQRRQSLPLAVVQPDIGNAQGGDQGHPQPSFKPVKIEPFDGTAADWGRYFDDVQCYIVGAKLTDAQKIAELKRSLGKDRKNLLAQFGYANPNVSQAIEVLKRTYGQEDSVVTNLAERLEAAIPLKRNSTNEDWQALLQLATEVSALPNVNTEYGKRELIEKVIDHLPTEDAYRLSRMPSISIETVLEELRLSMKAWQRITKKVAANEQEDEPPTRRPKIVDPPRYRGERTYRDEWSSRGDRRE